jgi:uncharacterized protein (UPF0210 family)
VDPISLGVAAAALLASKFGEGLAKDAGSSSWHAITRLGELITEKFGHNSETPSALAELERDPSPENQAAVAEVIDAAALSDPGFAGALRQLVTAARVDQKVDTIIANAYDNAKQTIIGGDVTGDIHF